MVSLRLQDRTLVPKVYSISWRQIVSWTRKYILIFRTQFVLQKDQYRLPFYNSFSERTLQGVPPRFSSSPPDLTSPLFFTTEVIGLFTSWRREVGDLNGPRGLTITLRLDTLDPSARGPGESGRPGKDSDQDVGHWMLRSLSEGRSPEVVSDLSQPHRRRTMDPLGVSRD